MTDFFQLLRSYPLLNLEKIVKEIWPQSDKWRLEKAKVEFSIPTSDGNREWFPLHQAPENVQLFVRKWYYEGGLSSEDKNG